MENRKNQLVQNAYAFFTTSQSFYTEIIQFRKLPSIVILKDNGSKFFYAHLSSKGTFKASSHSNQPLENHLNPTLQDLPNLRQAIWGTDIHRGSLVTSNRNLELLALTSPLQKQEINQYKEDCFIRGTNSKIFRNFSYFMLLIQMTRI